MKKVLAFDFGFSSGRAIIFTFDGEKLESEEISRFQNIPKTIGRVRCWDVDYLFEKIDQSVLTAIDKGVCAIGIDTWGVDAAIVRGGEIIVPPINYRDDCITGAAAETENYMPFETLYSISGIQRQDFNTVIPRVRQNFSRLARQRRENAAYARFIRHASYRQRTSGAYKLFHDLDA